MSDAAVTLQHTTGYRFEIAYDAAGQSTIETDLMPPNGQGAGPDPEKLLASAVAACLSTSLLFALRKYGNEAPPIRTRAEVTLGRNEKNRVRIAHIDVELALGVPAASLEKLDRTLATFEDFCVVTQSVRAGIPVNLRVVDSEGKVLPTGEAQIANS